MKSFLKKLFAHPASKVCALLVLTIVVAAYLAPHLVHAAGDSTETGETVEQSIAKMLSIGMNFLNALLWPFLLMIGELMDTDLILGPEMEDHLKAIWRPIRDLVNIAFALVLVVVALYNVLGLGGGEGELALKTALPKIVLGLVLVNFTLPIGKVILDLVNVATTATFALPELTGTDENPYDFSAVKDKFEIDVCYKDYDEATGIAILYNETTDEGKIPIHTRLFCDTDEAGDYAGLDGALAAQYFNNLNANNIGLVMAVNMGGLSNLSLLKEEGITTISDLTISVLFGVIMYLVFAISYIVLGIVLLTRLIVLWLALALSPVAVLVYAVPQIKEWAGGGGDFAQKVIKHLLAPVIIGATMSLGWIMISAWDGVSGDAALSGMVEPEVVLASESFERVAHTRTPVDALDSLPGAPASSFKINEVISTEFLVNGMDDLPQFIIALASIIIVWTGVFAAANDTYASFATEAIKGFGETVGKAVGKAPLLVPTIPTLSAEGESKPTLSILGAFQGAESTANFFSSGAMQQKQWDAYLDTKPSWKAFLGNAPRAVTSEQAAQELESIYGAKSEITSDEIKQVARIMADTVGSNSKSSNKDTIHKELTRIALGQGNLRDLQKLIDKYPSAEDFGFNGSQWDKIEEKLSTKGGLTEGTPPPTAPATPAATPTTTTTTTPAVTPAQTAAITAVVNLITPTSPLGTQAGALTSSTVPAAARVSTDVTNARNALGTLQATTNAFNLAAAKTAVDTALTNATAAQTDAAVTADAALKTSVDAAQVELQRMKTTLDLITL